MPDIQVTTKHTYEINYKFTYTCSNAACGLEFGRQKKIDLTKLVCGTCKSRLLQTKPAPKENSGKENRANPFAMFVKERFNEVKRENPGCAHKHVMAILSKMYREQKGKSQVTEIREEEGKGEDSDNVEEVTGSMATLDLD